MALLLKLLVDMAIPTVWLLFFLTRNSQHNTRDNFKSVLSWTSDTFIANVVGEDSGESLGDLTRPGNWRSNWPVAIRWALFYWVALPTCCLLFKPIQGAPSDYSFLFPFALHLWVWTNVMGDYVSFHFTRLCIKRYLSEESSPWVLVFKDLSVALLTLMPTTLATSVSFLVLTQQSVNLINVWDHLLGALIFPFELGTFVWQPLLIITLSTYWPSLLLIYAVIYLSLQGVIRKILDFLPKSWDIRPSFWIAFSVSASLMATHFKMDTGEVISPSNRTDSFLKSVSAVSSNRSDWTTRILEYHEIAEKDVTTKYRAHGFDIVLSTQTSNTIVVQVKPTATPPIRHEYSAHYYCSARGRMVEHRMSSSGHASKTDLGTPADLSPNEFANAVATFLEWVVTQDP